MVFLTFTIAVVNLCLGFALAVKLGYGPPSLRAGWDALLDAAPPAGDADDDLPEDLHAILTDEDNLDALLDDDPGDGLDDDLDDLLAEPEAENDEETTAAEAHETLDPGVPENWDLNEKFVETSVLKLNIAMMKSGARATEIDTRLRAARGHSDAETIHACLGLLKEDCQTYLAEQGKAAEQFHDRIGELGELSALGDEIEMTNLEQAAQIETTLSNLDNMDFETDLEAANKRLLEEISHLRRATAQAARQPGRSLPRHRPQRKPHRQGREATVPRFADEAGQPDRAGGDASRVVGGGPAAVAPDERGDVGPGPLRTDQREARLAGGRQDSQSPRRVRSRPAAARAIWWRGFPASGSSS